MSALRLQASPSMRLPASLAMALALHLLAILALPALWQLGGTLADRITGREAPPPEAHGEVIPIKLPTANKFELVTELGSIARSTSGQKADTLPSAQAARGTAMNLSQSLADAAREAQAAYERLHPQPEKLRFVAELRLADGSPPALAAARKKPDTVATRTPQPAPATVEKPAEKPADNGDRQRAEAAQQREQARQAQEAREMLAQAQRMAEQQARREHEREQAAERERKQRALQQAIDQASRQPLTRSPDLATQRPTPRAEDPPPKIFNPAEPYRGALPDVIAEAPPLPNQPNAPMTAGGPILGEGAAPERGPGEAVANRAAFFQRLTNHLFQINQIMLAEAIRATPRMTVEVRFTVDRNGRVIEASVNRSTGDAWLDEKAVAVIQRASPVPRLSSDMLQQKLELSFPVQIYR